jgi:archaellum biogenesis protein FlaJ (TadC family)
MVSYEVVGRLLSRDVILRIGHVLDMAGVDIRPETFAGMLILFVFGVPIPIFIFLSKAYSLYAIPVSLGVGIFNSIIIYVVFVLRIDARKNEIETVLPDFLQVCSSNVRAGMSIERALWFAARPEFGLLSEEITAMTRRTFGGEPFTQALRRLGRKFNSRLLTRTINLLIEESSSGGEVATLLEKSAWDARQVQILHKEISEMMLMYVVFIVFASTIGGPLLYALSYELINSTNTIWASIMEQNPQGFPSTGMMFLQPKPPRVSTQDFYYFSILSTIMVTFSASFIIAVVNTGSMVNGFKYAPFFVGLGLGVYFLVMTAFSVLFAPIFVK